MKKKSSLFKILIPAVSLILFVMIRKNSRKKESAAE